MAAHVTRRALLAGTGAAAAAAALAACSAPGSKSTSNNSSSVKKLTFTTNTQDPTSKVLADNWNKTHSSEFTVTIQGVDSTTYDDTFPQLAVSKDAPNIAGYFINGGHYADLAKAGALVELSDVWEKSGLNTAVSAQTKKRYFNFTPDGKVYAVPTNVGLYGVLFYSKAAFTKAGIVEPTDHRWTLDQFLGAAAKSKSAGMAPISVPGADAYTLSHLQDGILSTFMTSDQILDFTHIDYGSKEWTTPVQTLIDWNKQGIFADGFLSRKYPEGLKYWVEGKSAMFNAINVWQPDILAAGMKLEDIGWVTLPQVGPLPARMSVFFGGGTVIPSAAAGHTQAKTYAEYIVSPEASLLAAKETQVVSPRRDVQGMADALGPVGGSMYQFSTVEANAQTGWDDAPTGGMIDYDRSSLQAILAGSLSISDFSKKLESLKAAEIAKGNK